ncbi:glycosyltransferase family 2 protein [Lactiplantibacillus plantarum]|nr:glycosyltransferase family 2 protein [Lactiplantibacillus plantarum]MDE4436973.1 glycosyl transferase family 2 [Lactiplantibacillus plantarum]
MTKIACVIVTYNRKQLLEEALNSVLIQTESPEYVFVIDNASTDGTEKYINDKFNFDNRQWHYVRCSQNLGGSAGFAQGMRLALQTDCSWISISDDDAIFEPGYFEKLIAYQQDHPNRQILTGSVYIEDGRLQADQRNRFTNWSTFQAQAVPEREYRGNFEFDQYTFCGVFMSVAVIKQVGVADAGYFIWWDDCEYAVRTAKLSRPVNVSAAKLIHKTALPSLDFKSKFVPDWRLYYGQRNRLITIKRWRANSLVSLGWLLGFYARLAIQLCGPFYRGYRKMVIRVYLEALRDASREREGLNPNFMPGQKF